ncbi:DUF1153 domain-containing protein [Vreelandella stevensii]|uniref:DUF1153 domain-containing protein n=1 Tax=Halomonadaceae TaxID=28256 RepID=UPI0018E20AA6|nr:MULTISPECIES: DUF1153 domain-containing protein [Halomonas]
MSHEPTVKRWTAKRKASVVMDIFKGKATVAEVAREHDLTVSDVEGWMEEAQRSATWKTGSEPAPGTCASSTSPNCGKPKKPWVRPIFRFMP